MMVAGGKGRDWSQFLQNVVNYPPEALQSRISLHECFGSEALDHDRLENDEQVNIIFCMWQNELQIVIISKNPFNIVFLLNSGLSLDCFPAQIFDIY